MKRTRAISYRKGGVGGRPALAGLRGREPVEDEVGGAETEGGVEGEELTGKLPADGRAEGVLYQPARPVQSLYERRRRIVPVARPSPSELVEPHPTFVFDRPRHYDDQVRCLSLLDDRGHAAAERRRQVSVARDEDE